MYSCININVNTLVWLVEAKNQFPNFIFINKKNFQNKSSETNRTTAYIYLIVDLIYILAALPELI